MNSRSIVWTFLFFAAGAFAHAQVKKDHPLLSAYPGFEISAQSVFEYDRAELISGPLSRKDGLITVPFFAAEGRIHNTAYKTLDEKISLLQVASNYQRALDKLGAKIVFSCVDSDCFDGVNNRGDRLNAVIKREKRAFMRGMTTRINGNIAVLLAKLQREEKTIYINLVISHKATSNLRWVYQSIVEAAVLDTEKIAIGSVDELGQLIDTTGRAVLDGVYFDTAKADVRPDSQPTLEIIAAYLTEKTQSSFFVVGHTDATGDYDYNVKLSRDRAAAVVESLVALGVDRERLQPVGVGPVAPAASNRSEAGLANNRRVELVERL